MIKMNDLRKLSKKDAQKKLNEIERSLLELEGEGKTEKRKALKKSRARILTYIHQGQI
ncbi:MAG TPA: hypothetical protein VI912_03005 [Candidatus Bilamarchaeaceae archaeon]|nr:hypothetical protein [Candidatus Bilamarchaeaceae archaeon]